MRCLTALIVSVLLPAARPLLLGTALSSAYLLLYKAPAEAHTIKCTNYCVHRCETGLDLITLETTYLNATSEANRTPDFKKFKYGNRVFTLANKSVHGSTSTQYGDKRFPAGNRIYSWNIYTTLILDGIEIRCKPSWL